MRGLRIPIILTAFVVTVILAAVGNHFNYQRRVALPLLADIDAVPGVAEAHLAAAGNKQKYVSIEVEPDADVIGSYLETESLARLALGTALAEVRVEDNRDPLLTDTYYQMHFHIQQGIATGVFTDMAENIDAIAQARALDDHKVVVDPDRVFVYLRQGDHILFTVLPRVAEIAGAGQVERRTTALW